MTGSFKFVEEMSIIPSVTRKLPFHAYEVMSSANKNEQDLMALAWTCVWNFGIQRVFFRLSVDRRVLRHGGVGLSDCQTVLVLRSLMMQKFCQ